MKFVQLSAALLTAAFFLPGIARADGHGGAEIAVANAVVDYWAARNAGDHKTVANLESRMAAAGSQGEKGGGKKGGGKGKETSSLVNHLRFRQN